VFGFLKKKLKEGIDKVSKVVSEKEKKKIEEAVQEVKKEEHVEETKEELLKEVEEEIEAKAVEPEKPAEAFGPEKKIVEEIEKEVKEELEAEKKIEEAKETVETAKEIEHVEEKKGILGRLFKRKPKAEKPKEVEKGIIEKIKKKITEKKTEENDVKGILKDLEMGLISSDVALEASEKIINDLRNNLVGNFIKRGEIESVVKNSFRNSITEILKVESFDLIEKVKSKKPFLIVFLGFNGSGKTTSIARIGYLLKKNGLKCVFAAADCFRAASIEQLEEHGRNLDIEVIKHNYGADPAAVIFDAVKHAKAKDIDVILADTAGRSHANVNLMDELKKIIRVNNPDLKILVLDALTGNDIYDQCKLFNDAVDVDGLILTKADVYEKGGAAISASFTIKRPILYLGVGQNYEDLEKFDSNKIVERLLD